MRLKTTSSRFSGIHNKKPNNMKAINMIQNKLNARHVLVLEMLQDGKKTSCELAGEHLSTASITTTVDRLEKENLVKRRRDKIDRRRVFIHLTEDGRELLGQ